MFFNVKFLKKFLNFKKGKTSKWSKNVIFDAKKEIPTALNP